LSDAPAPHINESNGALLREILVWFGRGVVYSLAFWAVYRAVYFIYPAQSSTDDAKSRETQTRQTDAYDQQMKRAKEMLVESEKQQERMSAILSKQEEQAKRYDAVLERWEKQVGIRK
jgi:hypothetical protein